MASFGDHVAKPRNLRRLAAPTAVGRAQLEGDTVFLEIAIRLQEDRIVESSFESFLCGFAIGLCSLLTEEIKGLSTKEAAGIDSEWLLQHCPGLPEGKHEYARTAIRALHAALNQCN